MLFILHKTVTSSSEVRGREKYGGVLVYTTHTRTQYSSGNTHGIEMNHDTLKIKCMDRNVKAELIKKRLKCKGWNPFVSIRNTRSE